MFELFLAFLACAVATAFIAIFWLYIPIIEKVRVLNRKDSIFIGTPLLACVVFFVLTLVMAPMMFGVMLNEPHRKIFIQELSTKH